LIKKIADLLQTSGQISMQFYTVRYLSSVSRAKVEFWPSPLTLRVGLDWYRYRIGYRPILTNIGRCRYRPILIWVSPLIPVVLSFVYLS